MDADVNGEQCDGHCSVDGPAAPRTMVEIICGACGRTRLDRYILAASPADDGEAWQHLAAIIKAYDGARKDDIPGSITRAIRAARKILPLTTPPGGTAGGERNERNGG